MSDQNRSEASASLSEHELRKQKVSDLREKGISAWPEAKHVDHTSREVKDVFAADEEHEHVAVVAGRLMALREHGKTMFATIQDRSGTIQLYIRKDLLGDEPFSFIKQYVDLGDQVWVKGTVFRTKVGEITIKVSDFALLSKCLHPLPEKYHGLTDTEQRYRQRYLDIMSNPESREKFKQRSAIIQEVRDQLLNQDFLEVETPMLHVIPGGASARPFTTKHNAYDIDLYLRIAPELYLKRLIVGGLGRVFEINRNFRNEGVSTRHNPEFTMIELYMAHGTYEDGMALTEKLIHSVAHRVHGHAKIAYGEHILDFESSFARYSLKESLTTLGHFTEEQVSEDNINATVVEYDTKEITQNMSYGEKLLFLFEECVEHLLIQPTFITDYPVEVSPLAKRHAHDASITARFELFIAGMEIANCFSELNNPFDQAERFYAQVAAREAGDDEAHYFDADYVRALEYGMPPTVGVGLGIDRLVMLMTNTTSIKDVILFPTMRPKREG